MSEYKMFFEENSETWERMKKEENKRIKMKDK